MAFQLPAAGAYNTPVLNTASMEYFTWYYADATRGFIWQRNPQQMAAFESVTANSANYAAVTDNALYIQTPDSGSSGVVVAARRTTNLSVGVFATVAFSAFITDYSNAGSQWNGTTGVFTAAYPAVYKVETTIAMNGFNTQTYATNYTYIRKNGATYTYGTGANYSSLSSYFSTPGLLTAIIPVTTGDTISIAVYNGSTQAQNASATLSIQQVR